MKKFFFFAIFLTFFFAIPTAKANCDLATLAQNNLNDAYAYVNFGYEKPSLEISNAPLVKATYEKKKEYGKLKNSKGFIASFLDYDKNKIVIYAHVFDGHETCDDFVTQKLKRLVIHEYTHQLDQYDELSAVARLKNFETTAIIGENILPKMIWGKRNSMVLRHLTRAERPKAAKIRRFIFQNRNR